MKALNDFTLDELSNIVKSYNDKPFRAKQIYYWVHNAHVKSYDEMTNVPKALRDTISKDFNLTYIEEVSNTVSQDGSIKYLFKLEDGETIESVLLKDGDRVSGCISTQVGCRMGCVFCATAGAIGFKRNLTTGEILAQVAYLRAKSDELFGIRLLNLVFMGMGEPLDNIQNLKKALIILLDEDAFGFSHRRITVSTSGLVKELDVLFDMDTPVNLAVSINAPTQEKRKKIMPVSNKYPLDVLISALKKLELDKRKRITIEYVLMRNINDSLDDAKKLVKLLKGMKVKVNLIVYNESEFSEFSSPAMGHVVKFQDELMKNNLSAFIRKRLGSDIDGACGQLAGGYKKDKIGG